MKKVIWSLSVLLVLGSTTGFAQENRKTLKKDNSKTEKVVASPIDVLKFNEEEHNFGEVKQGDKAEFQFTFVNKSKQPITIQNVVPACGCTTPVFSKEPVGPKKKGVITVSYNTTPGSFDKIVTVKTNVGDKVLRIKGTVVPKS